MRRIDLTDNWRDFDLSKCGTDTCVIRYGAYGDMIQASSVLPALKEKGHHVVLNTTENGAEVMRHNPYIDTMLVQGKDQIKNDDLPEFWVMMAKNFPNFINLSESVEVSLLARPCDKAWFWHKDYRDMVMNVDYFDGVHAIAGCLDAPKRPFFFPSKKEEKDAIKFRDKLGRKNKVVVWVISGSGLHKVVPHIDVIFARLMVEYPNVKIVTIGSDLDRRIEFPWENEPRVIRKCGKWSIRESFAFLPHADLIMGPETGAMNAAAFLDVPKICFLSHSSVKNFGGNWPKADIFAPEDTPCYPCHKLHFTRSTCDWIEEEGVSRCAKNIPVEKVYQAVKRRLNE